MSTRRIVARPTMIAALAALVLLATPASSQQAGKGKLANVSSIRCTFPLTAVGTWGADGQPKVDVKPLKLTMQFEAVNADEGSAELKSGVGVYDIIVRYAGGYLNFIQSFRDGRLHTTTVHESEITAGKFRAMHSRHEYTAFALPGFTSSPEQYYGDCEILK